MIYFDFTNVYKDEYNKRLVNFSFYKFLDQKDLSLDNFINDILVKENEFSIVCANSKSEEYLNYFIRMKEYPVFIKGDFIVDSSNGYFKVKDIIVCDVVRYEEYEKEFSFNIGVYNTNRNCVSDLKLIKRIIKECPSIYDYRIIDFINKWDDYLEFERRFFKEKLGFYKTNGYSLKEIYQVKRSYENIDNYKDDIYFDDLNNYLYIDRYVDNASRYFVIEFEVEIKKDEGSYSKLHYFANQEIEIANPKDALIDNKLASKKELEFDFKTTRLGTILVSPTKVKESEDTITYSFSKFYNDEDSYYFNLNQIREYIETNYGVTPLLVNILSGDISLYKRGKEALDKLKNGDLYNPYLPSYLFNIHEFESSKEIINKEDIEWSNSSLDEYQKEAIYRSINSNSIFLLQGPPGTGKTQTISELVYQFNKMGKRVLLSSQTHVAIDNVLERLPNELNILPIRLVSSERKSKVDSLFLPNRVIDNLYNKLVNKYEDKLANFDREKINLKELNEEYIKINKYYDKYKNKRENYNLRLKDVNLINKEVLNLDSEISYLKEKIKQDKLIIKFIEEFIENDYKIEEYFNNSFLVTYIQGFEEFIKKYNVSKYLEDDYFYAYLSCFKRVFADNVLFNNEFSRLMEKNKEMFNRKLKEYKDILNNEEKLLLVNEEKKEYKIDSKNKVLSSIDNEFKEQIEIFKLMDEYYYKMFNKVMFASKIPSLEKDKLLVIREYLVSREEKNNKEIKKYNIYKNIYSNTINYIDEELIIRDRKLYTRYLTSNNANVYALTCNANSIYLKENNNYLKELGINDINLRNIDFDVVIIDEVSKANDIELLIPILYGKSIILVGDHRQLPPLFKYKEGMFEGLTIDKRVNKETLDKYEALVENSLFKKLFGEAKNNKFMLIKQYRSHKQIMDIVNLFYEDKLLLGNNKDQNNLKEHYLEVTSNDLKLFTKDVHTYWFNSYYNKDHSVSYEKKLVKGGSVSSSFYNESEIDITKKLLIKINEGYKDYKDKEISVGVISLYKDQVNLLKKEVNKLEFNNIKFNKSKISSVDEFQGKEEDIIIVNLVRNNKGRHAGDFVRKFERINVALSRARRMLIIVGAREFFESLEVEIENLDDVTIKKVRKLYKEIYSRIEGKIDNPYSYLD